MSSVSNVTLAACVFMTVTCLVYSSNAQGPGIGSIDLGPIEPDFPIRTCSPRCENGFCVGGRCLCQPGFTGRTCSNTIITVCYGGCANGGTCRYGSCSCRPGYSGSSCQIPSCSPSCANGGTCVSGKCRCRSGYSGSYCQTRVCTPSCRNGQICILGQCRCPRFLDGPEPLGISEPGVPEIDLVPFYPAVCCSRSCLNGGTCIGYNRCRCRSGYSGQYCQTKVPSCLPSCANGGTCVSGQCRCRSGYSGGYCQTRVCTPACQNGQICILGQCLCPRFPDGPVPLGISEPGVPEIDLVPFYPAVCCSRSCLNGGTCIGYNRCRCRSGYSGQYCQTKVRSCSPSCANGGTCVSGKCRCRSGYSGSYCQTRVCTPSCRNGQTCILGQCRCPRFLDGPVSRSEPGVPEIGYVPFYPAVCCSRSCLNGGTCIGYNRCRCRSGYSGQYCQTKVPSCSPSCANGGTCVSGKCRCRSGYSGSYCQARVCTPSCRNGQTCILGQCRCPRFLDGPVSRSEPGVPEIRDLPFYPAVCCSRSCLNGGTCIGYNRCRCRSGYSGQYCQTKVCAPACRNGGTCSNGKCNCRTGYTGSYCQTRTCSPACRNGGTCTSYGTCNCRSGYTGSYCQTRTCSPACRNGGTCTAYGTCNCKSGYTGTYCQIRSCSPSCANGGKCVSGKCRCTYGYGGSYCQTKVCRPSCQYGQVCISGRCQCPRFLDRQVRGLPGRPGSQEPERLPIYRPVCCSKSCLNGGTCIGYNRCKCRSGYSGQYCQTKVCSPACRNGGTCRNGKCVCKKGYYTGSYCQTRLCSPACRNGGTCTPYGTCNCRSPYTGSYCQLSPTCYPRCENGGTCIRNNRCSCPSGFTGSRCQNAVQTACRVRMEIHDMTQAQRQLYIDTYKTAYGQPALRTLLRSHAINFAAGIHTRNQFLPWHRWFILELENILLAVNSNVILPYWDWTLHSAAPWSAPLWGSASHWYGGDGSGSCVTTGPFRSGQFSLVSGGCLRRDFDLTETTPSALVVNDILSTPVSSFNDFELRVRGELHDTVHCRIHGTMCTLDAAESPDFFLHHVFIDKLWADYQARSTAHHDAHFSSLGSAMTAAGGHSAQDMIDLNNQPGGVCVRYEQPSSSTARQLRRALSRVAPSVIAKRVSCQPQSLDVSRAVQQGQELFRVSASERSRLSSLVSKQVCRSAMPGQAGPSGARTTATANLGFDLNTLVSLANAK
ncbi:fibropellin-1-like isoform X4 [Sycon ciliatum]|uniref:fibropellin-1-like isoform X4 n=1 Tax=Sycon ciliatum TaxID=27933 RepID=UPI0031F61C9A